MLLLKEPSERKVLKVARKPPLTPPKLQPKSPQPPLPLKRRVKRQLNLVVKLKPKLVPPKQLTAGRTKGVKARQVKRGVPKRLHAVLPGVVRMPPKVMKNPLPRRNKRRPQPKQHNQLVKVMPPLPPQLDNCRWHQQRLKPLPPYVKHRVQKLKKSVWQNRRTFAKLARRNKVHKHLPCGVRRVLRHTRKLRRQRGKLPDKPATPLVVLVRPPQARHPQLVENA